MQELSTCHCCEGISPETPVAIYNRPGLNAIAYRAGTYHAFRESLLSRFSGADLPALHKLTTRSNDDFTVSLLDAWAVVSDVLTFYQERIANEAFLRTATERFSVLQMARLIGYELRGGVASNTYLAFTLDDTSGVAQPVPGSIKGDDPFIPSVILDAGVKVQSVPAQGEQAQTFETVEKISARPEWNAIRPRLYVPQPVQLKNGYFIIDDITNDLRKGDTLLIRTKKDLELRKILSVTIDKDKKTTTVQVEAKKSSVDFSDVPPDPNATISTVSKKDQLDDSVLSTIVKETWKEEDLDALIEKKTWSISDLLKGIRKKLDAKANSSDAVFVFRKTASPFGYNAVKKITYTGKTPDPISKWKEWKLREKCELIYLDSEYKEIVPGSYVGVESHANLEKTKVFSIQKVNTGARSEYGMNMKSTLLEVSNEKGECWFNDKASKQYLSLIRGLTLFVQSEELGLAQLPVDELVKNDYITLDRWYPGLKKGQMIILTGERDDLKGATASEVMELKDVFIHKGYSVIRFTSNLAYTYVRSTVTINANVALATHGETVKETLGAGDASMSFQRFTLRQPPLTYTQSSSPTGTETTLKIYVNDILWHETDTFFGHGANERIYITRLGDDGKTTVIFGDGVTGSRLPTGAENVRAVYRKGTGLGGLVKANQLSQLLTRPLGVKSAINPVPSKGAADPENLDEARSNAPLTLLTFGRVVSLQDYEDFARAFAGIEKSLATWTWKGKTRCVFLTVAGVNGAAVSETDELFTNLLNAIVKFGSPHVQVELKSYRPLFFRVVANIQVDKDYLPEKVLPEVGVQLRTTFSFKQRSFGQPVSLSEVITVCQSVEGVESVDIDKLYYSDDKPDLVPILKAGTPVVGKDTVLAAELLTIDPGPIDIKIAS